MDSSGRLCIERAPGNRGGESKAGPVYKRSLPLSSIKLTMSLESRPTWVVRATVRSGYLKFNPHADDGVISSCPSYGSPFEAFTLETVNNEEHGDDKMQVGEDFYPVLHRMLRDKKNWDNRFDFYGLATFETGVLEWTRVILDSFADTLRNAGIYGGVAVSRYPYEYNRNVWRAFCELWGPLSNTLHYADGEMSISLYDLKVIGGLPISGIPYEEFIPLNKDLQQKELYAPTVSELLKIHSALCVAHHSDHICWDQWVHHFHRDVPIYAAFGHSQPRLPVQRDHKIDLMVSDEGKLAAYLAFWLSRFVFPSRVKKIRPETFHMACLMAQGVRVSLAPTTLGYIYHGLGEIATHPQGPGHSDASLPIHYVIGWLGEHFPYLYKRRADSEFPADYPLLARYAGVVGRDLSITFARMIFRSNESVNYRPTVFPETEDCFLIDDEQLSVERFEFLFCLRSAFLPVRVDDHLSLEPYYPNRFARQFGYDQSVPSTSFSFGISKRQQCFIEDLARAQSVLHRKNTTTQFLIPRSTRHGACTWWYCKWWLKACIPYLGQSVSKTFQTLTDKPLKENYRVFVVKKLEEVSEDLPKAVRISALEQQQSEAKVARIRRSGSRESGDSKRARTEKIATFEETLNGDVNPSMAEASAAKKTPDRKSSSLSPPNLIIVVENTKKPEGKLVRTLERKSSSSSPPKLLTSDENAKKRPGEKSNESTITKPTVLAQSTGKKATKSTAVTQNVGKKATGHVVVTQSVGKKTTGSPRNVSSRKLKAIVDQSINKVLPSPITCVSKSIPTVQDVKNFLCSVLDLGLASFTRDYIIGHVSDIFGKASSSGTSKDLIVHCEDIKSALVMLRPAFESLKSGKSLFETFTSTVESLLKLSMDSFRTVALLQENTGVDLEFASELISSYERCLKTKEDLVSRLQSSTKKLEELQATEFDIIADEERVKKRRHQYNMQKISIEETIQLLEESVMEQDDESQKLEAEKAKCMVDKLPEIEKALSSRQSETEKYQEQFDSLISLFPTVIE